MSAAEKSESGLLLPNSPNVGGWSEESKRYFRHHRTRLAFLGDLISKELSRLAESRGKISILDVAPHFTTNVIRGLVDDSVELNSLGWLDSSLVEDGVVTNHFKFDLNDVHFPDRWMTPVQHDIVVAGEIVEHLFAAPARIFEFLVSFVKDGGILVIQTPNAVSIRKRLHMLLGRNPFEFINERRDGHVREYTQAELVGFLDAAGLHTEQLAFSDYWPERGILRPLERLFPSFRRGITVVSRKTK